MRIIHGDCLIEMGKIQDKSVDMILCDLPYGTTKCKWDIVIPFVPLWEQYERVIKNHGAIVLTGSQPFTSALVMSNLKMFRYDLLFLKKLGTGYLNSHKMPLRAHENILVFYKHLPKFNPQKTEGLPIKRMQKKFVSEIYNKHNIPVFENLTGDRFPLSWRVFKSDKVKYHPTQKPVALFEYLIKTYTNEGDLVLDTCAGSGTTGVASQNLNRKCILIEKELKYIKIIKKRCGL